MPPNPNFSVGQRNPGHWDIADERQRIFRIRGRPSSGYHIFDERKTSDQETRDKIVAVDFPTDIAAMTYLIGIMMWEPVNQEHEDA